MSKTIEDHNFGHNLFNFSPARHFSSAVFKDVLAKSIHQSYFIVALAIGIVSGVILALIFRINYFASPVWLTFSLALLVIAYLKPKLVFIVLALLSGFIFAFFRVATELQGENYLRQFLDQEVTITGTVDGDPTPDESAGAIKLKLKNLKFQNREVNQQSLAADLIDEANRQNSPTNPSANPPVNSANSVNSLSPETNSLYGPNQALVNKLAEDTPFAGAIYIALSNSKANSKISRSDQLTIKGKLQSGFGTYTGYFYRPTVVKIQHPTPQDPILELRNWFAGRIRSQLPETEANLGLSYLLGMKTGLNSELSESLRTVGLVHIVVASGAHLSILIGVAKKIFGKISRFAGLFFAALLILGFMSLIGFTPSILRAGIMSLLTLLAWYVGRTLAPWRLILLVAAATLLINPMFIIDLGWLLSFASYAGIMILSPHLIKFFYGDKQPKFIASTIITTVSATLATLPITLYYFGQISLISVLANLLILPTLPYALGLTFAAGLVAGIPIANIIVSTIATKLLDFHIATVGLFASQTSFLIATDKNQPQFFFFYLLILIPLSIGLIRKKMLKLKEFRNIKLNSGENHVRT